MTAAPLKGPGLRVYKGLLRATQRASTTYEAFTEWVKGFKLEMEHPPELMTHVGVFFVAPSVTMLAERLNMACSIMRMTFAEKQSDRDSHFIWAIYDYYLRLWRLHVKFEVMEGWILGPLASYKHDGIFMYEPYDFDIMFIEVKPSGRGLEADKDKLGHVMSFNLVAMKDRHEGMNETCLRTYGILISGYQCIFLEAQMVENVPVIYHIHKITIPQQWAGSEGLGQGASFFLAFKQCVMNTILELRADHARMALSRSN
ncbi:hypothetical protein B0O80DRAFT_532785 [Mortierella sp. GBAus27b]|nr:hypothetical protein B0O80DRAFT_532785 [Mortierella sp. GBAus27b]